MIAVGMCDVLIRVIYYVHSQRRDFSYLNHLNNKAIFFSTIHGEGS